MANFFSVFCVNFLLQIFPRPCKNSPEPVCHPLAGGREPGRFLRLPCKRGLASGKERGVVLYWACKGRIPHYPGL